MNIRIDWIIPIQFCANLDPRDPCDPHDPPDPHDPHDPTNPMNTMIGLTKLLRKIAKHSTKATQRMYNSNRALQQFQRDISIIGDHDSDTAMCIFLDLDTLVARTHIWIELAVSIQRELDALGQAYPDTPHGLDITAIFGSIYQKLDTILCRSHNQHFKDFSWQPHQYGLSGSDIVEYVEKFLEKVSAQMLMGAKMLDLHGEVPIGIQCIDEARGTNKDNKQIMWEYEEHLDDRVRAVCELMGLALNGLIAMQDDIEACERNMTATAYLGQLVRETAIHAHQDGDEYMRHDGDEYMREEAGGL
jgi:hypothetical protein